MDPSFLNAGFGSTGAESFSRLASLMNRSKSPLNELSLSDWIPTFDHIKKKTYMANGVP